MTIATPGTTRRVASLALLGAAVVACHRHPPVDGAWLAGLEHWKAERLTELRAEDGWLSLVGLFWLKPGENRFGAAPGNEIVLVGSGVPEIAGSLELRDDGSVLARAWPGVAMSVAGQPLTERTLQPDSSGHADVVQLGPLRLYVIERAGTRGVRVKNPDNPARAELKELKYFPADPEYRVSAMLEPYQSPREVEVTSAHGPAQKMKATGRVRFVLAGRECSLEAFASGPDGRDLFLVFADATNGTRTYGAGRFLEAEGPRGDTRQVALDFNRAYSPPCAFTPYATCPLPTAENRLVLPVEAGELAPH
jgi:uncharacterized protein